MSTTCRGHKIIHGKLSKEHQGIEAQFVPAILVKRSETLRPQAKKEMLFVTVKAKEFWYKEKHPTGIPKA